MCEKGGVASEGSHGADPPARRAVQPPAAVEALEGFGGIRYPAWLGPAMHLVCYPVRGGDALNVAGFIEGRAGLGWEQAASADALRAAARSLCSSLQAVVEAVEVWKLWPVHDRAPLRSADQMVRGRAVLLGDAAHPMRPYLAQGAGMAIEDAAELQRMLRMCDGRVIDEPIALRRYALNRFERCARVQRKSRRNGVVFHADGALRVARNAAMRLAGERLMDMPWLYRGA